MARIPRPESINPTRRGFLKTTAAATFGGAGLAGLSAGGKSGIQAVAATTDISSLPRVKQAMVAPPFLPEHEQVAVGGPKVVEVTLTIEEK